MFWRRYSVFLVLLHWLSLTCAVSDTDTTVGDQRLLQVSSCIDEAESTEAEGPHLLQTRAAVKRASRTSSNSSQHFDPIAKIVYLHMLQRPKASKRGGAIPAGGGGGSGNSTKPSIAGGYHQWSTLLIKAFIGFVLAVTLLTVAWLWREGGAMSADSAEQSEYCVDKLDQDTYGGAIHSIILDSHMVATGNGPAPLRLSRLTKSLGLLIITVGLQAFMLLQIKKYCSAQSVYDIRVTYDRFELGMVGNNESRTTRTANGEHRAIPEYFDPALFKTLNIGLKEKVCNIPFSQPGFFMVVLLLWTLTVVLDFRRCKELFFCLIVRTPTVPSMTDALSSSSETPFSSHTPLLGPVPSMATHSASVSESRGQTLGARNIGAVKVTSEHSTTDTVIGLTLGAKAAIFWCVMVPRLAISSLLLYLGCRWLSATTNFSDLVLNTCALEFLLSMKSLLHHTLVPAHTKAEMANIELSPTVRYEQPGYWVTLGAILWGVGALAWVFCYIYYFQNVLPEYRWDVRKVCTAWNSDRYG
eukprot:gnl/TRDRNA2_/TRDRNA2_136712_c0_seq5.p1 gnl/TRDRNA2_/TRDRNA2_136712_c0~~gnl/TRDRNA2_/TRDRNA2_136712_c0_seq5.p1  ORF type:complete len:527 (+),score=53.56 gnl/TRDRNA2_/TRDRNA2_136712_c0_seq5:97-1677(+)